jgi:hypothetical protein
MGECLSKKAWTLQNPSRARVQHVSVSNTLETLLHACSHCIGREKKIFTYLKKFLLNIIMFLKILIVVIYVANLK